MDNLSHEFILPHEGPDSANTRAPSSAVSPPVDMQAQVEAREDDNDQPSSHTHYSEAYPHSAGKAGHESGFSPGTHEYTRGNTCGSGSPVYTGL